MSKEASHAPASQTMGETRNDGPVENHRQMQRDAPPVLATQTRNGLIENRYRGVLAVARVTADYRTEIIHNVGDIDLMFYPRSANKFVQLLPLIESGAAEHYAFTDEELAVMCASHNGEPAHLATVRRILDKIGCSEDELRCGSHTPGDLGSAFKYCQEAGDSFEFPFALPIYNNCSGKHAGMLALCRYLNLPTQNYIALTHPVQQLIRDAIVDIFFGPGADAGGLEESGELHVGVDGCCAPAFAMTVKSAASGYARLASPDLHSSAPRAAAITKMLNAVTSHSKMVHGTGGFDSIVMAAFKGAVFTKRGAAGCSLVGLRGRRLGFCVKMESGADEPKFCIAVEFLRWARASASASAPLSAPLSASPSAPLSGDGDAEEAQPLPAELSRFLCVPNLNCAGIEVGATRAERGIFPPSLSSPAV